MKFKLINNSDTKDGKLFYRIEEHSFDYSPKVNVDILIMLKDLTLGFDSEDMSANQVFGYHPGKSWIKKTLILPVFTEAKLVLEGSIEPGLPRRMPGSEAWSSYYDEESGWICLGNCDLDYEYRAAEFLNNVIVVLSNGEIKSLWLKPIRNS